MFLRARMSNGSLVGWGPVAGEAVMAAEEETGLRVLKGAALVLLVGWTLGANVLVLVVLKTNERLQTVPNLLVGNLAFSDICLSLVVLPGAVLVALWGQWPLGKLCCELWLSSDILCCTASIWNMSTIGLDRYFAITSPVSYLNKRNRRTAFLLIGGVWLLSALISIAPFLGWKSAAPLGNHVFDNASQSYQCLFLDLPAYTLYSATGSFAVPTFLMFYVYYKIYKAFEDHRARQIYRQKVIRRHIESTILHEISHVLPTSDEFAKSDDDEDEDEESSERGRKVNVIEEEDEEEEEEEPKPDAETDGEAGSGSEAKRRPSAPQPPRLGHRGIFSPTAFQASSSDSSSPPAKSPPPKGALVKPGEKGGGGGGELLKKAAGRQVRHLEAAEKAERRPLTFERVQRQKRRKERRERLRSQRSGQPKAQGPPKISASRERRGVRVLGIILGCFTVCWTPFFFMYVLGQFCTACRPNVHIEQFITWLGYSNSAMNPIIYTVFNRDYQNALKRLFARSKR